MTINRGTFPTYLTYTIIIGHLSQNVKLFHHLFYFILFYFWYGTCSCIGGCGECLGTVLAMGRVLSIERGVIEAFVA